MEDSSGFTMEGGRRRRDTGKAHSGAVNGLSWTDDGSYIVTAGHDDKIRVWDSTTGANTLASFGPTLKNSHLSALSLLPSPTATTGPGQETLFFPNEHEILMFELHEGRLLRRLKVPGPTTAAVRSQTGNRTTRNRTTALAWRGAADGIYSGHSDGQIRAWCPRTRDDDDADTDEALWNKGEYGEDEEEKKKRQVLDDVYRDLTRQKITFG
jgi:DNA excision repair protein ERCC-8